MPTTMPDAGAALDDEIKAAIGRLPAAAAIDVLRVEFPAAPAVPRLYARDHAMRRRVASAYLSAGYPVPRHSLSGWDLLAVIGLAFDHHQLSELERSILTAQPDSTVLLGLPREPLSDVLPMLLESAALRQLWAIRPEPALEQRSRALRQRLRAALSRRLAPDQLRWFRQGQALAPLPERERRGFYTQILEDVYPDTPPRLGFDRRTFEAAVDALLEFKAPLLLARPFGRGVSGLLQRAFGEEGLLAVDGREESYRTAELRGPCDLDAAGRRLFDALLRRLYPVDGHEPKVHHNLGELLRWLAAPPLGLRGPTARLYLAAACRIHGQDLSLWDGQESRPLAAALFRDAIRCPDRWDLVYRLPERHEQAFLRSLTRLFGGSGGDPFPASRDLWQKADHELRQWWGRLPRWARECRELSSEDAKILGRLLANGQKVPCRIFLGKTLPAAFGLAAIPSVEEQSALLDRLEHARQQLARFLELQYARLASRIVPLLDSEGLSTSPNAFLETGCRRWLGRLHRGTPDRVGFSPWAEGLRQAMVAEGSVDARWFEDLPRSLGMAPPADWTEDLSPIFLSRLAVAILELKIWPAQQMLPLPEGESERQAVLSNWIQEVLGDCRLSGDRTERLLLDLLEELVWD
ncbi:MAG: hypothetical protein HY319_20000 [Armatimonadetes bacterium]|nr:hypothetical protein [Armatimonadota bacterium]